MSVTAKEVADEALKLIFHVGEDGNISAEKEAKLYAAAPAYLTVLQLELAQCENKEVNSAVSALSDVLAVSDETALKVMPCGLAMYFALISRESELYNHFSSVYYTKLLPGVKAAEIKITDCYLSPNDIMMR